MAAIKAAQLGLKVSANVVIEGFWRLGGGRWEVGGGGRGDRESAEGG